MPMMILLNVVTSFLVLRILPVTLGQETGPSPKAIDFDYTNPASWATSFATCGGKNQSPIDLDASVATESNNLRGPVFYRQQVGTQTWALTTSGHSVNLAIEGSDSIFEMYLDSNFSRVYRLNSIHMHWSRAANSGSEHTMNGIASPIEIHLVHYDVSLGTLTNAVGAGAYASSLAVLGLFGDQVPSSSRNSLLAQMLPTDATKLNQIGSTVQVKAFDVYAAISVAAAGPFYRYSGSLTTPPCSENVLWTVFTNKLHVSNGQFSVVRAVPLTNAVTFNNRPVQLLGTRKLFYSQSSTGSANCRVQIASLLASLALGWLVIRNH